MLEYRVWSIEYRWSACLEVGSALRADLVAPSSVPDLHDCLKAGRSLPWPPFAKARATTGQSLRSYQSPSADVIVITSLPRDSHSKGDRKPEDWPGAFLPGPGSRPSGVWFGCSGSAPGGGKSVLCHLTSMQHSNRFGWRVAAPGGGWQAASTQPSIQSSTQSSFQPSVIGSALSHRSSHPPSHPPPPLSGSTVGTPFSTHPQFCLELPHPLGI
jgi:hypothetical protein